MMYGYGCDTGVCVRWGETSVLETRMRRVCSDVLTSVYAWNDVIIGRSVYRACVGYGRMGVFLCGVGGGVGGVVVDADAVGRTRSVGRWRSADGGRRGRRVAMG